VVWGGQRVFTKYRPINLQRGVAVTVVLGEPIHPEPGEESRRLLQRIRTAMEELLDEAQRTYPQQPAGPDDLWWQPAHLGGTAPTLEEATRRDHGDVRGTRPKGSLLARARGLVRRR
jgi:hypothetical protein